MLFIKRIEVDNYVWKFNYYSFTEVENIIHK